MITIFKGPGKEGFGKRSLRLSIRTAWGRLSDIDTIACQGFYSGSEQVVNFFFLFFRDLFRPKIDLLNARSRVKNKLYPLRLYKFVSALPKVAQIIAQIKGYILEGLSR